MGSKDGRYVIPEAWLKDAEVQKRIRVIEKKGKYKIFLVIATAILLIGVLVGFLSVYI
jgi:uncharacterized membrane protein YukC